MTHKRLTLFAGHYGSGKTNIALNYARWLRRKGEAVTVADLDIVNPYFRTKDSEEDLKKEGIGLIVSPFANSNLDVPAMPKETYALIGSRTQYGVLDIGGDDAVIGGLLSAHSSQTNFNHCCVPPCKLNVLYLLNATALTHFFYFF